MKKQLIALVTAGMMISPAVMKAEAKTESIWVLTTHDGNALKGDTDRYKRTYVYDKNGLVKSITYFQKGDGTYICKLKYDKNGNIQEKNAVTDGYKTKYKTDDKGNVIENDNYKYAYNKKGLLVKAGNQSESNRYYYNKKNQITKIVEKDYENKITTTRYKYDSHGSVIKEWTENQKHNITYTKKAKYKYNSHQLISQMTWESTVAGKLDKPELYKYKKINVKGKYIRRVKAQQKAFQGKNGYFLEYLDF